MWDPLNSLYKSTRNILIFLWTKSYLTHQMVSSLEIQNVFSKSWTIWRIKCSVIVRPSLRSIILGNRIFKWKVWCLTANSIAILMLRKKFSKNKNHFLFRSWWVYTMIVKLGNRRLEMSWWRNIITGNKSRAKGGSTYTKRRTPYKVPSRSTCIAWTRKFGSWKWTSLASKISFTRLTDS